MLPNSGQGCGELTVGWGQLTPACGLPVDNWVRGPTGSALSTVCGSSSSTVPQALELGRTGILRWGCGCSSGQLRSPQDVDGRKSGNLWREAVTTPPIEHRGRAEETARGRRRCLRGRCPGPRRRPQGPRRRPRGHRQAYGPSRVARGVRPDARGRPGRSSSGRPRRLRRGWRCSRRRRRRCCCGRRGCCGGCGGRCQPFLMRLVSSVTWL